MNSIKESPFQMEYHNGGNRLFLVRAPKISIERSDRYMVGDLGCVFPAIKETIAVEMIDQYGESLSIVGNTSTVMNILEKLK
jgi:hypothetical protein